MNPIDRMGASHGGNLDEAERLFGRTEGGWLDLSTGINAVAYPNTEINDTSLRLLPQPAQLEALLSAARVHYRIPKNVDLVAGPGSQALIQWLPMLVAPRSITVLGPTYSEHARTWLSEGHRVSEVTSLQDAEHSEVVIVVNPNNPDGRTFTPAELIDFARQNRFRGGFLVVDEAFADVAPEASVIPFLKDEPIIVLRSIGKFFGLPGLRLGFAVGVPKFVAGLEKKLGPWAVPGPTLEIGIRSLNDRSWTDSARIQLRDRREQFDRVLIGANLGIIGGTDLFRLVHDERAAKIYERLGRAGILVRRFQTWGNWLRLGVPGTTNDLRRFEQAIKFAMSL